MYWCIMYCYMTHHPSSCIDALCIVTWPTTLHHVFMHYVLLHDPPPFIMYWCIMYCYMTHHPSSCIHALCIVTWPTTLHHVFMHYVLLHDPPPFIMYWCIMYCYMTHHPSSCIHALCIVTWPTTLHHVLMHYVLLHEPPPFIMYCCIMYCYIAHHPSSYIDTLGIVTWSTTTLHHVLLHYVLLHRAPPFIIVKVIRNSEVLTIPTSFDNQPLSAAPIRGWFIVYTTHCRHISDGLRQAKSLKPVDLVARNRPKGSCSQQTRTGHQAPMPSTYGGWKKSCTNLNGWNHMKNGINKYKKPINWCRISSIHSMFKACFNRYSSSTVFIQNPSHLCRKIRKGSQPLTRT